MKGFWFAVALSTFVVGCNQALARDTKHLFPLADALNTAAAKEKLNKNIKFYFGDQAPEAIAQHFGSFTASRKTNAFNKSDKQACEWAFLSAILALQARAEETGANAVLVHSYYKKNVVKSSTQYECGAGALMAGVTLVGEVVKLEP